MGVGKLPRRVTRLLEVAKVGLWTRLASARASVRKSADMMKKEVSTSLRKNSSKWRALRLAVSNNLKRRAHSTGTGSPVVVSTQMSLAMRGGVTGRRSCINGAVETDSYGRLRIPEERPVLYHRVHTSELAVAPGQSRGETL